MSGCQNPVTLCSILSSLSPSLSRTFRDAGFFFRGIHVSEIHFRELSRKTCDKSSPFSVVKCVLKPLIPSTTDIVFLPQLSLWQHLDRYCIWWPPPPSPPRPPPHPQPRAPDLSGHCQTSTASARFQWALPDPNCDRGSQWAQPDTTSARSQWALPLPHQMGGAIAASQGFRGSFAELSRSFRGFSGHIYRNLWIMYRSVWIQIHLRKLSTNILKTRILSLESLFPRAFAGANLRKSFRESFANVVLAFAEPSYFNSPLNLHLEVLAAAQIAAHAQNIKAPQHLGWVARGQETAWQKRLFARISMHIQPKMLLAC